MNKNEMRQLSKDYFAGVLTGEDPVTRDLIKEACGGGCGPMMVEPEVMGIGPMGMGRGAMSQDSAGGEQIIGELDKLSMAMQDTGEGCLTSVVSALSHMLHAGDIDPTQLRDMWNTLFDLAQTGAGDEY